MVDATRDTITTNAGAHPDISLSVVMQAASSLVSCAEPDVVFESLVQRCAPLVCEAATATVSRLDGRIYATTWPVGVPTHWSQPESVVIDFNAPASGDYAGYHGLVSFRFRRRDENGSFIAQLLVERALAVVERQRLLEAAASRAAAADHLERALASNREIGVAVGILMVTHQLTDEQAFDLLSRVSQRTNRKLRLIAVEVARTGAIELPPGVAVLEAGTRRRRRLASVAAPRAWLAEPGELQLPPLVRPARSRVGCTSRARRPRSVDGARRPRLWKRISASQSVDGARRPPRGGRPAEHVGGAGHRQPLPVAGDPARRPSAGRLSRAGQGRQPLRSRRRRMTS